MSERIQPIENREFISSIGNWTGDMAWDPGPIGGQTGLVKIDLDPYPAESVGELLYPYAKPVGNKENIFLLHFFRPAAMNIPEIRLSLSDGVYTFEGSWTPLSFPDAWIAFGYQPVLPSDWNVSQSIISFTTRALAAGPQITIYMDLAGLWAATRVDHLPIMGIG